MLCRTVGLVAAVALGANAFLLPPGANSLISKPDLSALAIDAESQSIRLHCSECVFPSEDEKVTEAHEEGDDVFRIQGGAKDVLLNFSITDDHRTMTLNGIPIYPIDLNGHETKSVDQVASSASLVDIKNKADSVITTPLRVSAESLFINTETISDDSLVTFTYQILSLEDQPVSLDGIQVRFLKSADMELMIISVDAVPRAHSVFDDNPMAPSPGQQDDQDDHVPNPRPGHGHDTPKECSMLLAFMCNWKNTFDTKLPHKFGGCPGRKGGRKGDHRGPGHELPDHEGRPKHHHGPPPPMDGGRPEKPHHGPGRHGPPPHGSHGHHGMHHGHRHGHFLHRLVKGFVALLAPIMAGITMGLIASLIGMLAGRLIGYLWIRFGRGGQRGYASLAHAEESTDEMEKGTAAEEADVEPLPVYEAAPAYE